MEFRIEKEILYNALRKIQGIIEKNPVIPIASNLLIEIKGELLTLKATNFEVGILLSKNIPNGKEGTTVVNAQKFFEIVREMPEGEILVSVSKEGWIEIKHGNRITFNLAVLSDEQYPVVQPDSDVKLMAIEAALLYDLVKKTAYACSDDRTRGVLCGVMIEREGGKLRMVATDGHRMALAEKEVMEKDVVEGTTGVIIPRKGAKEIRRVVQEMEDDGMVDIGFGEKNVTVKTEDEVIIIRVVDGKFPDYKRVIPENNTKKVTLKREELIESLKRVMIVSEEETREVTFRVEKGLLVIFSKKVGIGDAREERSLEYDGDEFEFALNSRYVMDVLNSLDSDEVVMEVEDDKTPVLIKERDGKDSLAVVMPMAL